MKMKKEIILSVKYLFTVAFFLFFAGSQAHTYGINIGDKAEGSRGKVQAAVDEETLNLQSSNNSLNCIPTGQLRIQIQKPKAGQTYKVQLTAFPTGYTGPTEFTISADDKDGAIAFVKFTGYDMPAGNYKGKIIAPVISNTQEVPATIGKLVSDFPAPIRSNNDFGNDQAYRDIQSGGQPSCDYLDIRYSNNTTIL